MDDIRYRVWCRNNNEWEKDEMFLAEDGSLYHVLRNGRLQRCRPDTHTVQFFTGLRDSKRTEDFPEGQEIHKGDICLNKYGKYLLVDWDNYNARWILCRDIDTWYSELDTFNIQQWELEVVGNIFESMGLFQGGDSNL